MPDILSQAGLGTLAAAVRHRLKRLLSARLRPFDLTIQQFWVILVLLDQGSKSLHPLAQHVWMDDPTASRVVKALVGRGLLHTQSDPRHGRRILISLTPSALPLAHDLAALAAEIKAALVTGLSLDEQEVLRHGLFTMITNLDDLLAEGPASGSLEDAADAS